MVPTPRVLQVLADTEESDENLAALGLHQSLSARGWAVRTLALAPGKNAGLATKIPVMAPTRRSLAAVGQLRTEQAWADLVLLRGMRTAAVARLAGSSPPKVLALWSEPQRWSQKTRISKFETHLLGSVKELVVGSDDDLAVLAELGVGEDGPVARVPAAVVPAKERQGGSDASFPEMVVGRWMECLTAALPSRP